MQAVCPATSPRNSEGAPAHQEVLEAPESRSVPIARRGLRSTRDVKAFGLALAEDVVLGAIAPKVSGAAVSAVGMTLRTMSLELRQAETTKPSPDGGLSLLEGPKIANEEDPEIAALEKLLAALEKLLAERKAARAKVVNETPGTARGV